MMNLDSNALYKASSIIDSLSNNTVVKRVKKDRGLMERSNAEQKIILEEDNRQVIFG